MGVRHVVMFRWADGVEAEQVDAVTAGLTALRPLVPTLRDYRFGPDVGVNTGNYDYVVVADFDDIDGYLVYRDHPDHKQFIADLITGKVTDRAAVQFETP
jgi:Stress responsive A/B Barrel Domain